MSDRKPVTGYKLPDLKKPVEKLEITPTVPCFGEEWDITTRECAVCSANEVCAIITQQNIGKKVKAKEEEVGYYLDQQDFEFDTATLLEKLRINSGKMTSSELVEEVAKLSKSRDDVAIVNYVKRLVKSTEGLSIKSKIVYYD